MAKPKPAGPRCPGCGYDIFGIREMRCPECGRTLDVRDFSVDAANTSGDLLRYERNSAVGALIAVGLILALLIPVALVISEFAKHGFIVWQLTLFGVFLALWAAALLGASGQSLFSWLKSGRSTKRRR